MKQDKHFFTCEECGGHELTVVRDGLYATKMRETKDCTCGNAEDGLAYFSEYITYDSFLEEYALDENHEFDNEIVKDLNCSEEPEDTEGDDETFCQDCRSDGDEMAINREVIESESYTDKEEYKVICANCRRKIEFEWYNNTIWPVECSDFHLMGTE